MPSILDDVGYVLRATAAEIIVPRFASLHAKDIEMKDENEPVTIADREAEERLTGALRAMIPGARVLGEEAAAADPRLLDNLDVGVVWVIDPIDGTANFASGRLPFATMVALLRDGESIAAWILDPMSGRLAVAERGSGAWLDGKRLRTSSMSPATECLRGIISEAFVPASRRGTIDRIRMAVGEVAPTARCAGHEYPLVGDGSHHFALYWRTLIWDHAPGALLLTEAGGAVTHLNGTPYCPTRPQPGLLLAHNPLISGDLLSVIGSDG